MDGLFRMVNKDRPMLFSHEVRIMKREHIRLEKMDVDGDEVGIMEMIEDDISFVKYWVEMTSNFEWAVTKCLLVEHDMTLGPNKLPLTMTNEQSNAVRSIRVTEEDMRTKYPLITLTKKLHALKVSRAAFNMSFYVLDGEFAATSEGASALSVMLGGPAGPSKEDIEQAVKCMHMLHCEPEPLDEAVLRWNEEEKARIKASGLNQRVVSPCVPGVAHVATESSEDEPASRTNPKVSGLDVKVSLLLDTMVKTAEASQNGDANYDMLRSLMELQLDEVSSDINGAGFINPDWCPDVGTQPSRRNPTAMLDESDPLAEMVCRIADMDEVD
jgi:hypothetical protein